MPAETLPADARLWLQMQLRPDRVEGGVRWAMIDPGAVCNLACPFCPTGNGTQALSRELLSEQRFFQALDRLGPSLRHLYLFHNGESLLHPGIYRMIAAAAARGIRVLLHSHLSLPAFDDGAADRLVASGLAELTVSCDGASQASYERYRVGGDFALVMRNLERVLEAKRRARGSRPDVVWKYLVHDGNRRGRAAAARRAAALGVPIRFLPLLVPEPERARWAAVAESAGERAGGAAAAGPAAENPHGNNCLNVWDQPLVHADGTVLPCCVLSDPAHSLGNLFQEPFENIWNKPLSVAMRRYLRTGKRGRRALPCHSCPLDPHKGSGV